MTKSLIIPAIALLLIAAEWTIGGGKLHWSVGLRIWIAVGITCAALLAWVVHVVIIRRNAKRIEKGVLSTGSNAPASAKATAASNAPEVDAMRDQFRQYLTALKGTPSGKGALATLPWYMVLGAPGSGKTTLLQESGLAFSSLGHGLRSVRGIGGTRNCDWWFTDRAIFLDTAGRYTTQPEDQGEWLAFLDLIRRQRSGLPVNGILVVLSVSDVLRDQGAHISEIVRPIRERIIEVSSRLGVVLPVYVVFTKADLIGGFKDFFAGLPRNDRKQVWGFSLDASDRASRTVEDLYDQKIGQLLGALAAKRMASLLGDRPVKELSKAVAFPGNFAQVQDRLRTCVGELFRPFPLSDQPLLRGVYFTSALPPLKSGMHAQATVAAPARPLSDANGPSGTDVSIFFQPSQPAGPAPGTDSIRSGFFLGDLFHQVILGDGGVAGRPSGLRRLRSSGRALAAYGSIAATLLISTWLVIGALGDRALATAVGDAGTKLSLARTSGDAATQAAAREGLRQALAAVDAQATPWRRDAIAAVGQRVYFPMLSQFFLQPAAHALSSELAAGLDRLGKEGSFRDLFTLFSAYQQLAGLSVPDRELLSRVLVQTPRMAGKDPSEGLVLEAGRHLDYLVAVMPRTTAWKIDPDKALLDRVRAALGDNVWIQEGYGELIGALQSGSSKIGRDDLVGGDDAELLEAGYQFSAAYTAESWRQEVEPAIGEKAEALAERIANLGRKQLSASEIRRRLRSLYARDYQANWLRAVAELKPAGYGSVAEAAAKLQTLTDRDSPYQRLPRALALAVVDFNDVDLPSRLPTSDGWLVKGLADAQELQTAVARFVASTEAGARGRDLGKVQEFCGVLDGFGQKFAEAANTLDDAEARRAATACLQNLVLAVHKGLLAELANEVERSWNDAVRKPFTDACAGKFPFDPAAKAEADLRAFTSVFNPKSGAYWQAVKYVEALRQMKILGRELFPVSVDYQRVMSQATVIRGGLFADDSDVMVVAFVLTLQQREAVEDEVVAIGSQRFGLFERPDRRSKFEWRQSSPGGAKISITVAKDDYTRDEPSPGWGILRLLRAGVPQKRPDGGTQLTWAFPSQKLGKTFFAATVLDAPDLEALVTGDLLKTFTMPERITR